MWTLQILSMNCTDYLAQSETVRYIRGRFNSFEDVVEEIEVIESSRKEDSFQRESTPEDDPSDMVVMKKQRTDDDVKPIPLLSLDDDSNVCIVRLRAIINRGTGIHEGTIKLIPEIRLKNFQSVIQKRYSLSIFHLTIRSMGREGFPCLRIHVTGALASVAAAQARIDFNLHITKILGLSMAPRFYVAWMTDRHCFSFYNRGFCEKGPSCPYFHGEPVEMNVSDLEQVSLL